MRFLFRGVAGLCLLAVLAFALPSLAANQIPSVGGPANTRVSANPTSIAIPDGTGGACVVGEAGCSLSVTDAAGRALPFAEQTATVTASQTWQGSARDAGTAAGATSPWPYYWSQIVSATQAGTQYIKCSATSDFATSRQIAQQAISAGAAGASPLKVLRGYRYCRTEFTAGGSNSDVVAADGFVGG